MAPRRCLTSRAATQPRRGLDHDEAATYVGVSFANFDQMVLDGRLPRPVNIGDEDIWDLEALDKAFSRLAGVARNPWD